MAKETKLEALQRRKLDLDARERQKEIKERELEIKAETLELRKKELADKRKKLEAAGQQAEDLTELPPLSEIAWTAAGQRRAEDNAQAILDYVRAGYSLISILKSFSVPAAAWYAALEADAALKKAFDKARAHQLESMKDRVLDMVVSVNADNAKHMKTRIEGLCKAVESLSPGGSKAKAAAPAITVRLTPFGKGRK